MAERRIRGGDRDRRSANRAVTIVRRANRWTRKRPGVRRAAIAAYATAMRANRRLGPPRVVLNGPAKSGTHLLADCLALLPRMRFSGRHFVPAEYLDGARELRTRQLDRYLDRCPPGMFVTTHAAHRVELDRLLSRLEFRKILLLRDPRDIAVSLAHFLGEQSWLRKHYWFRSRFDTPSARLLAAIEGYADPGGERLAGLGSVMATYLPWLEAPGWLVVRFEDLVGVAGGGDEKRQADVIRRVARHVDRPIGDEAVDLVARSVFSEQSLTFRRGRVGGWREEFEVEHREAFARDVGPLMSALGYTL